MIRTIFFLFSLVFENMVDSASQCICTTVPCPVQGNNIITEGGGGYGSYYYIMHNDYPVVINANGAITPLDLDHGTDTTSCTQHYSRMLDDDGIQDCDAGHILANRIGGYGNEPLNIFPQDASVNRGSYAQFENLIYHCIDSGAKDANFNWEFAYENETRTKPYQIEYSVSFNGGNCTYLSSVFTNGE